MTQSFVARIWLEPAVEGDPKWRGHIQHIQGGEEVYFQDLTEMCDFLEQVSGVPGPRVCAESGKRRRDLKPRSDR
jgi:hypothetical protein